MARELEAGCLAQVTREGGEAEHASLEPGLRGAASKELAELEPALPEIGVAQIRAREVCELSNGVPQIGAAQVGPAPDAEWKDRVAKAGTTSAGTAAVRELETGAERHHVVEARTLEIGVVQAAVAQVGTTQVGMRKVLSGEECGRQPGVGEVQDNACIAPAPVRERSAVEMHGGEMIGVGHAWLPAVTFVGRGSDCQACTQAGRSAVLGSRPGGFCSA
ncbi:MAG: hypothetical protein U1F60_04475 [Planctomycetota bacterium]